MSKPQPQSVDYYPPVIAWPIFSVMMLGNFMAILDVQIVASSLNEMRAGMSASQDEIIWVQTIYLICEVISIALAASLSKIFSTRIYFAYSALGFTFASMLCGIAWDMPSLLFFRAIQGFFGGGMVPTAMGAMFMLFPPQKISLPLVIVGMINTTAPTLGPIVGGWITNHFSWHWLFFVNLLPGLVVFSVVLNSPFNDSSHHDLLKRIDWLALLSLALFLGCIVYVLDEGPRHDWFDDQAVSVAFCTLLIAGIIFFWRTHVVAEPIVDLSVFTDRNFAISTIIAFTVGIVLYGLVYITPFFLGTVRGLNSQQIGEIMLVTGVSMFITALLYGFIFSKFDSRYNIFCGLLIVSVGVWLNSYFTPETDFGDLFWAQIVRGFGLMICMISISKVAMDTLPREKIRGASGIINLMRNVGGAIGFAIINTMIGYLYDLHQHNIKSRLSWGAYSLNQMTSADFDSQWQDPVQLLAVNLRIRNIALSNSLSDLMTMLAVFLVVVACLVFFLRNGAKKYS